MIPGVLVPCGICGVPSPQTRCPEHPRATRARERDETQYGRAWRNLSKRARRLQPFCQDCGTKANLTTDHTPAAHHARLNRRPITLAMVEVVCASCNAKRGPAIPGSRRYEEWEARSA
ncbi:hypothetical protein [Sporichthya polymorpha]|uniref:hypothetical protein n=1 Tax=Sporichthya polymorpha TaxID=35751 RepID=UPI00035F153E|nr:hypothetical protein [Sporichthya polymorpha]